MVMWKVDRQSWLGFSSFGKCMCRHAWKVESRELFNAEMRERVQIDGPEPWNNLLTMTYKETWLTEFSTLLSWSNLFYIKREEGQGPSGSLIHRTLFYVYLYMSTTSNPSFSYSITAFALHENCRNRLLFLFQTRFPRSPSFTRILVFICTWYYIYINGIVNYRGLLASCN